MFIPLLSNENDWFPIWRFGIFSDKQILDDFIAYETLPQNANNSC